MHGLTHGLPQTAAVLDQRVGLHGRQLVQPFRLPGKTVCFPRGIERCTISLVDGRIGPADDVVIQHQAALANTQ